MLCEKCGKHPATTHIRSVVNGVVREKNLCGYCAAKEGYNSLGSNSLATMLASMFSDTLSALPDTAAKRCENCGSTFSDIAESGKAGCSECYKAFYSELLPYLKRVHGSVNHQGKIPNSAPLIVKPEEDSIQSLRNKLSMLIAEENFEEAAIVRDKIKEMEGEEGK